MTSNKVIAILEIEHNNAQIERKKSDIVNLAFCAGAFSLYAVAGFYLGVTEEEKQLAYLLLPTISSASAGLTIKALIDSIKEKARLEADTSVLMQLLSDKNEEQKSGGFRKWI